MARKGCFQPVLVDAPQRKPLMIPIGDYYQLLVEHLRPLRRRVFGLAVLVFATVALTLLNPQFVRRFIDLATTGGTADQLIPLALWFIAVAIVIQVLSVTTTYLAEDIGWSATNRLRAELARHVLDLDMSFHKAHTPGELIERIDGDVTALSNFFSAFVIKVVANALLIAGILVVLWLENVWVGFGITVFALIAMVIMLRLEAVALPWWKAVRATSAKLYGFIGEQLAGTEDIRANGGVPYMMFRLNVLLREWLPQRVRGFMGFGLMWSTGVGTYALSGALVFWLGSLFFGTGALTLGSVYVIFFYTEMMRQPMEQIRQQMEDFQKANAGIARVRELLETESVLRHDGEQQLSAGPLSVSLEGVHFAYDDAAGNERVLQDVTFELAPGRVLGVLGRSGSGKTTIARLLTRLYDPQHGRIALDGVALPDVDRSDLRRRVGMVTQDVQLFNASVRDNITFFGRGDSDEHLRSVIDSLELRDWIRSLPDGLDTELDAGGGGLSAGQGQLLAFTRIFLRNPGLVILDEASSRLDPTTEVLIERAVDRLLDGRTGIIIAHRLATISRADDVLILDDGLVAEYGERHRLLGDPHSRLSQLMRTGMEEVLA